MLIFKFWDIYAWECRLPFCIHLNNELCLAEERNTFYGILQDSDILLWFALKILLGYPSEESVVLWMVNDGWMGWEVVADRGFTVVLCSIVTPFICLLMTQKVHNFQFAFCFYWKNFFFVLSYLYQDRRIFKNTSQSDFSLCQMIMLVMWFKINITRTWDEAHPIRISEIIYT